MERVRLMGWCRTCVSGMHLPAFAAQQRPGGRLYFRRDDLDRWRREAAR